MAGWLWRCLDISAVPCQKDLLPLAGQHRECSKGPGRVTDSPVSVFGSPSRLRFIASSQTNGVDARVNGRGRQAMIHSPLTLRRFKHQCHAFTTRNRLAFAPANEAPCRRVGGEGCQHRAVAIDNISAEFARHDFHHRLPSSFDKAIRLPPAASQVTAMTKACGRSRPSQMRRLSWLVPLCCAGLRF
jgi:hypothetical protein